MVVIRSTRVLLTRCMTRQAQANRPVTGCVVKVTSVPMNPPACRKTDVNIGPGAIHLDQVETALVSL